MLFSLRNANAMDRNPVRFRYMQLRIVFLRESEDNERCFAPRPMDRMFTVLPKVLHKRGLHEHAESALVVFRAERWLHTRFPTFEGLIRVQKLANNTLHIVCTHSIALQECQASIPDLHKYLHADCSFKGVTDIRITRS